MVYGIWKYFSYNEELNNVINFKHGVKHGAFINYDISGKYLTTEVYEYANLLIEE
jgi:antitoxin component YwqK of YwqJK toxin-antitoxin module